MSENFQEDQVLQSLPSTAEAEAMLLWYAAASNKCKGQYASIKRLVDTCRHSKILSDPFETAVYHGNLQMIQYLVRAGWTDWHRAITVKNIRMPSWSIAEDGEYKYKQVPEKYPANSRNIIIATTLKEYFRDEPLSSVELSSELVETINKWRAEHHVAYILQCVRDSASTAELSGMYNKYFNNESPDYCQDMVMEKSSPNKLLSDFDAGEHFSAYTLAGTHSNVQPPSDIIENKRAKLLTKASLIAVMDNDIGAYTRLVEFVKLNKITDFWGIDVCKSLLLAVCIGNGKFLCELFTLHVNMLISAPKTDKYGPDCNVAIVPYWTSMAARYAAYCGQTKMVRAMLNLGAHAYDVFYGSVQCGMARNTNAFFQDDRYHNEFFSGFLAEMIERLQAVDSDDKDNKVLVINPLVAAIRLPVERGDRDVIELCVPAIRHLAASRSNIEENGGEGTLTNAAARSGIVEVYDQIMDIYGRKVSQMNIEYVIFDHVTVPLLRILLERLPRNDPNKFLFRVFETPGVDPHFLIYRVINNIWESETNMPKHHKPPFRKALHARYVEIVELALELECNKRKLVHGMADSYMWDSNRKCDCSQKEDDGDCSVAKILVLITKEIGFTREDYMCMLRNEPCPRFEELYGEYIKGSHWYKTKDSPEYFKARQWEFLNKQEHMIRKIFSPNACRQSMAQVLNSIGATPEFATALLENTRNLSDYVSYSEYSSPKDYLYRPCDVAMYLFSQGASIKDITVKENKRDRDNISYGRGGFAGRGGYGRSSTSSPKVIEKPLPIELSVEQKHWLYSKGNRDPLLFSESDLKQLDEVGKIVTDKTLGDLKKITYDYLIDSD